MQRETEINRETERWHAKEEQGNDGGMQGERKEGRHTGRHEWRERGKERKRERADMPRYSLVFSLKSEMLLRSKLGQFKINNFNISFLGIIHLLRVIII